MGKELTRWAEGIPVPARTSSRGRRVDQTRGSGGGGMGWMILVPLTVTRFMTSYREEFRGIPVLGFWW